MGAATDRPADAPSLSAAPPALGAALGALDAAGVHWCVLRGAAELAHAGEVDLLVPAADVITLEHTVARAGGFRSLPAWGRAPHRFFVRDVDGARIKLDVVTELAFGRHGELRTDPSIAGLVLARRRRSGDVHVPAPDDAFWALLLHAILDREAIRPERAAELRALAASGDTASPLATVIAAACTAEWNAARVRDAALAGRFDELTALAPALREHWPHTSRRTRAARIATSRLLRRADRARPVRALRARARARAQSSGLITSNSRLSSTG